MMAILLLNITWRFAIQKNWATYSFSSKQKINKKKKNSNIIQESL